MDPVRQHFDSIAAGYDGYKARNAYYYEQLKHLLGERIPPGSKVLEIGCGTGDLLASLAPAVGIGVDLSPRMIDLARARHRADADRLRFEAGDVGDMRSPLRTGETVDHVFMVDVVEHLQDRTKAMSGLARLLGPDTRLLVTFANPLWEPILMVAERLGLKMPEGPHERVSRDELAACAVGAGLREVERGERVLLPKRVPGLSGFVNGRAHRWPGLRRLCLIQFQVFRLAR